MRVTIALAIMLIADIPQPASAAGRAEPQQFFFVNPVCAVRMYCSSGKHKNCYFRLFQNSHDWTGQQWLTLPAGRWSDSINGIAREALYCIGGNGYPAVDCKPLWRVKRFCTD